MIGVILLELCHRWTAETSAWHLGSAIKDPSPTPHVASAPIVAVNSRGSS